MNVERFEYRFQDCYVLADETTLTVGNALLEQRFDVRDGALRPVSVRNVALGDEWLRQEEACAPLFRLPGMPDSPARRAFLSAEADDDLGTAEAHLRVRLDVAYRDSALLVRTTWRLYPGRPFAQQEVSVKRRSPEDEAASLDGFAIDVPERESRGDPDPTERQDYIYSLPLRELHCRYEAVELRDVTDRTNTLVRLAQGRLFPAGRDSLDGNLLFLEKALTPSGLLVVKEGPTPAGRLGANAPDFAFEGRRLIVQGSGLDAEHLAAPDDDFLAAYGSAIGVYDGTETGRSDVLDAYHRGIRIIRPELDFFLMSNTWGDRSRDGRVSEPFLLAELEAAARLGVTHVQVDDGWQAGTTVNSANAAAEGGGRWSGYHAAGSDFWRPHPERLPNGLTPIASRAAELGIQLGLWFSPDSDDDFRHWEKDADILLSLHRTYGVRHFKIDGVMLRSKRGERNVLRLMRKVVAESGNGVYLNLDTTAQVRLGYFGRTQYGGIFLENRYTDWSNYYPHWTLRNLWMLSKYVPARKLQMEFLNVRRNQDRYGDDPLAPDACGPLYGFAAALFSNPLAWMELSGLEQRDADALSRLVRLVAPYRDRILSGRVLPIGDEPSGAGWTGLQAAAGDSEGCVLVFRERNLEPSRRLKLWGHGNARLRFERVAGIADANALLENGVPYDAAPDEEGRYRFELPAPLTFALYTYRVEP
ncbi:hypothetical protein FE782_24450 [Paenibacillus antri]|uniref:Alpha-galactosidase n=1 Tax=Paenibacillus antri TaxID=2582848 RepID=A0A5R9G5E1_9BACL|nr:alpha-galactosidase [Paenibacillus antri]TLS49546.1 hypothetical protein FE782_24450 [Paenibacillus antri]